LSGILLQTCKHCFSTPENRGLLGDFEGLLWVLTSWRKGAETGDPSNPPGKESLCLKEVRFGIFFSDMRTQDAPHKHICILREAHHLMPT
jgi:hypothetical protein